MTWLDIILFLILVGIVYTSFSLGLIRVASILIGMYVGVQVAASLYRLFAYSTADTANAASVQTNEVVWFGLLWVVWSIIASLIIISFSKHYSLPKKWGNLDQIGGLALGVMAGVFGVLILSFVIRNTLNLVWSAAGRPDNYLFSVVSAFQGSLLMGIFKSLKVIFINVLSPWIPGSIPVFSDV